MDTLVVMFVIAPKWAATAVAICTGIGLVVPPLLAVLIQPAWSPRTKAIISTAAAVLTGLASYVLVNGFNFTDWTQLLLWIIGAFTAMQAAYHGAWKPLGVIDKLEMSINAGPQPEFPDWEGEGGGDGIGPNTMGPPVG